MSEYAQFRCTMGGLLNLWKEIKPQINQRHLKLIKKTPFAVLLTAIHKGDIDESKRVDATLDAIIKSFSPFTSKFKIGTDKYAPTDNDVRLIFGIDDHGKEEIYVNRAKKDHSDFAARIFPHNKSLTTTVVRDKIIDIVGQDDDQSVEDTVILICLYTVGTVLLNGTGIQVPWKYINYVENLDRIKDYNWARAILQKVMESLPHHYNDPKTVSGCTLLILYWFCEHYSVLTPQKPQSATPRCAKWVLRELGGKITPRIIQNVLQNDWIKGDLTPTLAECKKIKCLQQPEPVNEKQEEEKQEEAEENQEEAEGKQVQAQGKQEDEANLKKTAKALKKMEKKVGRYKERVKELKKQLGQKQATIDSYALAESQPISQETKSEDMQQQHMEREDREEQTMEPEDNEEQPMEPQEQDMEPVLLLEYHSERRDDGIQEELIHSQQLEHEVVLLGLTDFIERQQEVISFMENTDIKKKLLDAKTKRAGYLETENKRLTELLQVSETTIEDEILSVVMAVLDTSIPKEEALIRAQIKVIREKKRTMSEVIEANTKDEEEDEPDSKKQKTCKLKPYTTYRCYKHLNPKVYEKIKQAEERNGDGFMIYKCISDIGRTFVTVDDCIHILEDNFVSAMVIDAYWEKLVRKDLTLRINNYYVKSKLTTLAQSGSEKHRITQLDNMLHAANERDRLIFFPIWANGRKQVADHFVLLTLDTTSGTWRFYNSLKPRNPGPTTDKYYDHAVKVKEAIDGYLDYFKLSYKTMPSFDLLSQPSNKIEYVRSVPEQPGSYNDCAIYVCYFIERLARRLPIETNFKGTKLLEFKAGTLNSILEEDA